MTDEHHLYAEWVAAYTLGALDADDRRAFEAHLDGCARCAAELAGLAPLPALLGRVDRDDVEYGAPTRHDVEAGRAAVVAAARSEVASTRRAVRRWQLTAAACAAAAIGLVVVPAVGGEDEQPPILATSVIASSASTADVSVSPRAWGTEVALEVTGLPWRESYRLWTVDSSGSWVGAGAWTATPTGGARVTGASSTPTDAVDRILITSEDRDDVLVEART